MSLASTALPSTTLTNAVAIQTSLGWIAMTELDNCLTNLTFGHRTRKQATRALHITAEMFQSVSPLLENLADRLNDYSDGYPSDFSDIEIDVSHLTPFAQRVVRNCRKIRYGQTLSYGELAKKSGSPSAARAVGSVMAKNRLPLVVPCHRVVAANRQLGGFSAPGGCQTKIQLLAMENAPGTFRVRQ